GNIGRGVTGQLFSESGFEVVFVDIVPDLVRLLNERRSYPIRIASENPETITVTNVRAVSGTDVAAVAEEIRTADIMCTAVGVNVLPRVAPTLAAGIEARAKAGVEVPINIIICENLQHMAEFLSGEVKKYLPAEYHTYLDEKVGFVESVVGRMVPVMTEEQKREDPLLIIVEPYKHLPVSKAGIKGEWPEIVGVEPKDNFQAYVDRKLYTHNAGHAASAYFGYLKGYEFVYQAVQDPQINAAVRAVLAETGEALIKKHGFEPEEHQAHIDDLISRFGNVALGDQVSRVGGDPLRKLGPEDRLVGGAKLALEYDVFPANLCKAIAAALHFEAPGDPTAPKVREVVRKLGPAEAICEIGKLSKDSPITLEVARQFDKVVEEFRG
ncbi:MAG: mannitol-1-phosphate 5-dehydrogenase, partial [Armatimonadetes bacterium]|nr:mannitol-1-phosphate 5-dehydrogenase [Armatimonadota bacterium]